MVMPTKEKTWQYNVNQLTSGSGLALFQTLMLAIKNSLVGFGLYPWLVWGSSSGAGAFGNNDGVDRWATTGNLIWAGNGSNHSWIVLRQPGLDTNAALCIDLNQLSNPQLATFVLFPTGVGTNGTATARPSATDEIQFGNGVNWCGNSAGATTRFHVTESNDGQCTRVVLCQSNIATGLWMFDRPKNPVSGWSPAMYGLARGVSGTKFPSYAYLNDADYAYGINSSTTFSCYMTSEGWGAATRGEQITFPDDDTAEYPVSPVYLASIIGGGRGVAKGSVYYLWWGSTAVATGDTYPGDGTKVYAQFGDLIFPWNGSAPLIT